MGRIALDGHRGEPARAPRLLQQLGADCGGAGEGGVAPRRRRRARAVRLVRQHLVVSVVRAEACGAVSAGRRRRRKSTRSTCHTRAAAAPETVRARATRAGTSKYSCSRGTRCAPGSDPPCRAWCRAACSSARSLRHRCRSSAAGACVQGGCASRTAPIPRWETTPGSGDRSRRPTWWSTLRRSGQPCTRPGTPGPWRSSR